MTHEIYELIGDGCDVQSVFLDISKAFSKEVWHEGIIFKLKQRVIYDGLLRMRKQRIVLSGKVSI